MNQLQDKLDKWISCKNSPNVISEEVYFYNPVEVTGGNMVKGICIDQDEHGFSVRFMGITWNVRQIKLSK